MDKSNTKKDFDEYKCDYEKFKEWLLSEYINESDYENYKTALESIIYCEMGRFQYDRTKKYGDGFLDEGLENFYRRLEIKDQFEQWVKDYTEFKKEEQIE